MCQVRTGTYVSPLAPENADYTACHPEKTTTYTSILQPIETVFFIFYVHGRYNSSCIFRCFLVESAWKQGMAVCVLHIKYQGTGGPKRPVVPGFPVTLVSRCFIGTVESITRLTRCF